MTGRRGDTAGAREAPAELRVAVREDADVAVARQAARAVARGVGLRLVSVEALATAVSEIARNIVVHSRGGEVRVRAVEERGRRGVEVVARDDAPGIPDLDRAMRDGYSTSGTLGLGLSAARRHVDAFDIQSAPGAGTKVTMKKWRDDRED